jgi:hypothetical protein
MAIKKILIAGTGQLGSRYLQGLALYKEPLEIWLQDPSEQAIHVALDRWKSAAKEDCPHEIKVSGSGDKPSEIFDLAIVSTNADIRPAVTSAIARKYDVRNWLLEKVLAQSETGINEILRAVNGRPAWVNTPMHLWSLYSNLRGALKKHSPIHAIIDNFEGLACSSIHFIDYISRCNGSQVVRIDAGSLHPQWVEAKRLGFMEVNGELRVEFSDGSTLCLRGNRDAPYHYKANVVCNGEVWNVNDEEGIATSDTGRIVKGRSEFQSELTALILESIFSSGTCGLPTLIESANQHQKLLKVLLAHYNAWKGHKAESVPIT